MKFSPKTILMVLVGVFAVVLAARVSMTLPGGSVPHTLQTLAVLLVGLALGPWLGAAALVLYLVLGAVGLPVFADGSSGVSVLLGPTGGFLVGFVLAAALVGHWRETGGLDHAVSAFFRLLAAHALILLCGLFRLSAAMGFLAGYAAGVKPFLLAAILKSGIAAAVAVVFLRWRGGGKAADLSQR